MIAIKDMEMPTKCSDCLFNNYYEIQGGYICEHLGKITDKNERWKKKLDNCPLVEIVTCKDCKNYIKGALDEEICLRGHELIHAKFFCADAESEEKDADSN